MALAEAPDAFRSTLAEWSGAGDNEARWRARLTDVPLNLAFKIHAEPVGMVSAAAGGVADAVDLMSMWVSPKARGRGVGQKAIEEVTSWAARRYPGRFVRLAVRSNNEPAIRLYRRRPNLGLDRWAAQLFERVAGAAAGLAGPLLLVRLRLRPRPRRRA